MKATLKFIVVIFILFLGDNVYCQPLEYFDNERKGIIINQTERSSLAAERNMRLQIELLNSIMSNKYSNYSKVSNNPTFVSPVTFTTNSNGQEASELTILEDPKHIFDKSRNAHIPGNRYYERYDTDRSINGANSQNSDPWWCEGFLSTIRVDF